MTGLFEWGILNHQSYWHSHVRTARVPRRLSVVIVCVTIGDIDSSIVYESRINQHTEFVYLYTTLCPCVWYEMKHWIDFSRECLSMAVVRLVYSSFTSVCDLVVTGIRMLLSMDSADYWLSNYSVTSVAAAPPQRCSCDYRTHCLQVNDQQTESS